MLIAARFVRVPSEQIVRFGLFLGEHIIVVTVLLLICSIVLAGVCWWTLERHADDLRNGINKLFSVVTSQISTSTTAKQKFKSSLLRDPQWLAGDCLGLRLAIGIIIIAFTAVVFLEIADEVGEQEWLTTFDQALCAAIHQHAGVSELRIFEPVTQLGSAPMLAIIGIVTAVLLAWFRRWPFLGGWLSALAGIGVLESCLKETFKQARPKLQNSWITEGGWGFPSGHVMASVVMYGFLAYMLVLTSKRTSQRLVVLTTWITLSAAVALSRLGLGVHYFSDVLAGFVVAFNWLAVCVTLSEIARSSRTLSWLKRPKINIKACLLVAAAVLAPILFALCVM